MILPDVELFEHKNPAILHAKWICVSCADKNMIPDDQRRTDKVKVQSRGLIDATLEEQ